jgi:ferrochelatase
MKERRVLVFCPSFVADCLETLHEIEVEYREAFMTDGGGELQQVEGLNDSPLLIHALAALAAGF